MIKLLIGGSPCTYWSIAQKNNRETEAAGIGWELFKNYLIAKEKFRPDYFLYENNKSAAEPIKAQIRRELGVWDGSFITPDSGARYIEINSALVSAQHRQRFYVHNCGEVQQPVDRHIYLKDILETIPAEAAILQQPCDVPVSVRYRNRREADGKLYRRFETSNEPKANAITTVQTDSMVAIPLNTTADGKAQCLKASCYKDGIRNLVANNTERRTCVAVPIQVGALPRPNGELSTSIGGESLFGQRKSRLLMANGGGGGAKTGLYAIPVNPLKSGKARCVTAGYSNKGVLHIMESNYAENPNKQTWDSVAEPIAIDYSGEYPIYEVKDGLITIKGKQYPIKLVDGFYIIRKLTVTECCRLQTLPDNYCRAVSKSQAYKGLGNGWTAEVIIHILANALNNVPRSEKIVVLSMYDGIGTGRYCLDKLGFNNVEYHAYEIDKYAMQISASNYPDIIQHGDAFAVRDADWKL